MIHFADKSACYTITLPNGVKIFCEDGPELDAVLALDPQVTKFQPQQLKLEVVLI